MNDHFLGIDVGTGSARAGLFDGAGRLVAVAKRPIRMWREAGDIVEQSSEDIWQAVSASVREALATSGVSPTSVRGVGFDATCSLVVLDAQARPLAVGPSGEPERNVIVWMDHRAMDQTRRINATGHAVLDFVGGTISPEMETPKLLWLKENQPETFAKAAHFFDLADFLTFRATGAAERSVCTVTCKWTYLAHERRWDRDYFETIGLGELAFDGFARIGSRIVDIATPLGNGLTAAAADDLGLRPGLPVGASLIDAHAGGVGTLGAAGADGSAADPASELALIMGTSLCSMALTREPVFVDGVWGPYFGAMLPGYWLLEGGQSAYGAALDHLIALHPAHAATLQAATAEGATIFDRLEANAIRLAGSIDAAAELAGRLHVVPELLGNRAPEADPHATGVLAGLTLAADEEDLTRLFVAVLCGLCYGTRQIIEANREKGVSFETIVVSGGAARSQLLRRILSDASGLDVALPQTPEPVLLGAAMLGAVASGAVPDLAAAAVAMCHRGATIHPNPQAADFHRRKYEAFRLLQQSERRIRALFAEPG
ncbi:MULTISPECIES: FGGY-family carbohydrate kinase [unclassified Aureimonas]|uniref:FGGY-family carbohydrate kinase n=1 Tax=unclassified Aureimonas TaxID=2615206 RepID=UPI0006FE06C6|nr:MULTISPECIES: FGGY-family carbohydrate kinase [unclassified Aureimonas]KQT64028.1 ribulokinase [Aureimonas sp. Leaf427]KQT81221.1 ribulokinase [Aureimonas sp. Leaf460]